MSGPWGTRGLGLRGAGQLARPGPVAGNAAADPEPPPAKKEPRLPHPRPGAPLAMNRAHSRGELLARVSECGRRPGHAEGWAPGARGPTAPPSGGPHREW